MKAFELHGLYESFIRLMDSEVFTPEQKVVVGAEMISSLPPHQFCVSTPHTHRILSEAMHARLEKLNAKPATPAAEAQPGKDAGNARKGKNVKGQEPLHSPSGE